MGVFLVIIFFLVVAALIAAPVFLISSRRMARERKNYERGLKMVPLLIHLPPISEDIDTNGRDARDIIDENVSKAQIIYNIIASTYEKSFKRRIYGQQHLAFEIVSAQGFIYFYATVPVGLVDVVSQAIVSAYPSARLEEAEEHNIFSSVGKASGTTGGELTLKESFAYPIATYVDLKRDAMQSLLNSLSNAGKEDGAAIQILMRPADPGWRRTAHTLASNKRKGKDSKNGAGKAALGIAKEFGTAFYKAPEAKDDKKDDKPELSDHEQEILNAIDDKTRYPAYEVLIRLVSSSNVSQRSQTLLNNMVAAFSVFDAPGKNGFKYEPAKDVEELITSYAMRFFPQEKNKSILNSVELATIFHFPDQRNIPTTQLERQDSKQVDGPRNVPETGLLLGYNLFRGVKKPIRLSESDRQRHMYVVGQTGTGKSTFLENLALQDMMSGNGFAFVDPHGDTAEKLLAMVPKERTEDVIYFCPADMDFPMGLNLFEFQNPDQKDFLIQEALNMLKKLYDPNNQGIMGPRYEHLFRNAALTVMADPAGGTFIDIPKLFRDPQYVKQKLQYVKDVNVLEFWQKEMPQSQRSNEFGEVVSWFVSKFGAFLSNEMMRNIIGQTKSAFDLRDIMDNKKILLVNLSKGRTGDLNSKLLGMVFVMKFQAAAMSRANIPESERVDFSLYVDEFQNFSTDSFATIMSEARKYHLNLIVANQFTTQLTEEIRDAVFGNMGTIVAFRIGQNDVESLSRYFQPIFDGDDLLRIPNHNTIVRTLIGGVPTQSFSMATLPPLGNPNPKLADALKQLSAAKFGHPKSVIEKDIMERITTKEPAPSPAPGMQGGFGAAPGRPGFGGVGAPAGSPMAGGRAFGAPPAWQQPAPAGGFGSGPVAGVNPAASPTMSPWQRPAAPFASSAATPTPPKPSNASFLDEWFSKRGSTPPIPASPFAARAVEPGVGMSTQNPSQTPQPSVSQPAAPISGTDAGGFSASSFGAAPTTLISSPASVPRLSEPAVERTPASADPDTEEKSDAEGEPVADELGAGAQGASKKRKRRRRRSKAVGGVPATSEDGDENKGESEGDMADPVSRPSASGVMTLDHDAEDLARLEAAKAEHRRHESEAQAARAAGLAQEQRHERQKTQAGGVGAPGATPELPTAVEPIKPRLVNMPVVAEPPEMRDGKGADAHSGLDTGITEKPRESAISEVSLRSRSPVEDELSHGDTIYIDQDGNLQVVEGDEPTNAKADKRETSQTL